MATETKTPIIIEVPENIHLLVKQMQAEMEASAYLTNGVLPFGENRHKVPGKKQPAKSDVIVELLQMLENYIEIEVKKLRKENEKLINKISKQVQ